MRLLFDALAQGSRASGTRTRLLGLLSELKKRPSLELGVLHGPLFSERLKKSLPEVTFLGVERSVRGAVKRSLWQGGIYRRLVLPGRWDRIFAECAPFPRQTGVIPVIHDLRHLAAKGLAGACYRCALRRALARAERIHVVSKGVGEALARFKPKAAQRICVVPDAVDGRRFHPHREPFEEQILERLGVEPPYMLVVGHLVPRKDPALALALRQRLLERGVDLALLFVGRGPLLPEEELGRMEASYSTGRAGWCLRGVGDVELPVLYRQASLLLAPARLEGFGMAPLEGAASGTPLLLSDIPAHREVLGPDAALYAPPGDVEAFEQRLLALLGNEVDVAEMRERALERARSFTWARAASALLAAL